MAKIITFHFNYLSQTYIPYSTFGGDELAQRVGEVIKKYNGIILGNHGVIACGASLEQAYACAEAIEFVCKIYFKVKGEEGVKILSNNEMNIVLDKFKKYGQK